MTNATFILNATIDAMIQDYENDGCDLSDHVVHYFSGDDSVEVEQACDWLKKVSDETHVFTIRVQDGHVYPELFFS